MCSNGKLFCLVLRRAAAQLYERVYTSTPLLGFAQELCPDHQPFPLHTHPKLSPPAHPVSLPPLTTSNSKARRKRKARRKDTLLPHWQDGSCLQSPVLLSSVWN